MAKIALITGAYRGLGLEAARQLLAQGFEIVLTARRAVEGKKAADSFAGKGKVYFIPLDVTQDNSIQSAAREFSRQNKHLDVLINNAAVYPDPSFAALNTPRAVLNETFNINTASPLMMAQHFLPFLAASPDKPARIVNVSSGMGALHDMGNVGTAYSISKTALNAVTRQLASALAEKKIVVNSVCPGWVRTDMGGSEAPRSVQEGAEGIVWLATQAPADKTGLFWRDHQIIPW